MKKLYIPVVLIASVIVVSLVAYKHSTAFKRLRYELVMKTNRCGMASLKSRTGCEDAVDQPGIASLMDYFKMVDPQTGTIPRERLYYAYLETRTTQSLKSGNSGLQWTGTPADP